MASGSAVVIRRGDASWMGRVLRGACCALAALTLCAMAVLGAARSSAAVATRIDITSCVESGSMAQVTGQMRTADSQAVGSLHVTIYVDGAAQGTTATAGDGTFAYEFAKPGPGGHTVDVVWAGDARYDATQAQAYLSITQVAVPTLSLSLDPASTTPNTSITVTGSLAAAGAPIVSAVVTLTTSYGAVDARVATGGDGSFAATVAIPDGAEFPPSFTVSASYAGDGLYQAASGEAVGAITAPSPQPTQPTPPGAASPRATPSMAGSDVTPVFDSLTSTDGASDIGEAFVFNEEHLRLITMIFGVVAAAAAVVMIILGVVSHHNKRLAADERRGFGTNFGKSA